MHYLHIWKKYHRENPADNSSAAAGPWLWHHVMIEVECLLGLCKAWSPEFFCSEWWMVTCNSLSSVLVHSVEFDFKIWWIGVSRSGMYQNPIFYLWGEYKLIHVLFIVSLVYHGMYTTPRPVASVILKTSVAKKKTRTNSSNSLLICKLKVVEPPAGKSQQTYFMFRPWCWFTSFTSCRSPH